MSVVLGLDAGGTFTDAVVIDAATREVLHAAKTPTTPDDLSRCVEAAFGSAPRRLLGDLSMVSLSTTLATNAVVEGRGCSVGLVLIGGVPRGALPAQRQVLVQGRYDLKGRLVENIDPGQIREAVESLRGDVDAVAVSGYASVRNPDHERYVSAVVEDRLGLPVVCAHELSSQLGYLERTVTAVLNARLVPLVWELTDSVRDVMARYGVDAPLMLVRGDGTLMPEGVARSKPIETILSGPAASAIGAVHLSGRPDCSVVDIGGTTTDVVQVRHGEVVVRNDGAQVGDWRTQVRAAEVVTVGLGGDSRVYVDDATRLRVGPTRSLPWALAALENPQLVEELVEIRSSPAARAAPRTHHEAYVIARTGVRSDRSRDESVVLAALADGAHTVFELARSVEAPSLHDILAEMAREGAVRRISLTPTDLWHVTGEYCTGSVRASELALGIMAESLGTGSDELVEVLQLTLRQQLELAVAKAAEQFSEGLLTEDASRARRSSSAFDCPVVAVGGPAATWLRESADPLPFEHEVPHRADVANAIGAAVAHAVERVEILIRKDVVTSRFLVFSPQGRRTSRTLEEATASAVDAGRDFLARVLGVDQVACEARVDDVLRTSVSGDGDPFVERLVTVTTHLAV